MLSWKDKLKGNPRRQKIRALSLLLMVLLFPIILNFFSPYIIVDGASRGIATGSFITFGALFLGSLLFGRAFCGWLCPGGGITYSWGRPQR